MEMNVIIGLTEELNLEIRSTNTMGPPLSFLSTWNLETPGFKTIDNYQQGLTKYME